MKQRYIFELDDFKGCGQLVIRESSPLGSTDISFALSVSYKVGYIGAGSTRKYMLIALSDGLCMSFDTMEALIDHLNNDVHGYRPLNTVELDHIMQYNGNRF